MRRGVLTAGITFAAMTGTLAACSSSPSTSASTPPPATSATSVATSAAPTTPSPVASSSASTSASTSAAPTTSAPPRTTTAAASTSAPRPSAPGFTTTCRSLRVDVLKGGAIRGMEIAAMQFTNTGSAPCTVTGTPTAVLLRNGSTVGPRSVPNGDAIKPFTLQPGEYGEALLRDFSTCNAPLSDQLRLTAPSRKGTPGKTVTQPIKLRACKLVVAPVGEPS